MSSLPPSPHADLPPSPHADLLTDRLVLRTWSTAEIEAVAHGTRLGHWAEDFPAEGDQAIAGLLAGHPQWLGEYGHRLIIERESGLAVGSIGLFWPPADGRLELGYGVVATRRGRGYAAEATRALTAFALAAPGVHTVCADIEPSNPASARVLEKAGFRRVGSDDGLVRFRADRAEGALR
ncbi:GNAT family N-acetyltransferase [Streptomyces resistomycificus]|uniref:Acetyltransferase n=1 Tax=Streptomyces resistomycificus TaxID=67356 RepID=A0A0L8KZZ5_9ACTN|nr:GNAT family N-acetyltransferase [Streptomyces resistomycificus]KOG31416.1 acetyltransferase [Streptomyces resistomycificus]KUN94230.1 acetyltransferase [Streptomyces resistomycificus]